MFHQASLKLGLDRAVLAHARNEQVPYRVHYIMCIWLGGKGRSRVEGSDEGYERVGEWEWVLEGREGFERLNGSEGKGNGLREGREGSGRRRG